MVASRNCCLPYRHETHADIFDNISGRKGERSHFLGVDLFGLGYDGNISVINSGIEQSKQTERQSRAHFRILILGVNKVDLVVGADISVGRKLSRHVDR